MTVITIVYHCLLMATTLFFIFYCKEPFFKTKFICCCLAGLFFAAIYAMALDITGIQYKVPSSNPSGWAVVPLFSLLRLFVQGLFLEGTLLFAGGALRILLTSNRTWQKRLYRASFLLAMTGFMTAVGIDAFWIEPYALQVKKIQWESEKIESPIRIVFMSDIQLDFVGKYEKRILKTIKEQKGDLILFGGDHTQYSRDSVEKEGDWLIAYKVEKKMGCARNLEKELNQLIKETCLDPSLGAYAVAGTDKDLKQESIIFEGTPFQFLGKTETVEVSKDLILTGLSPHDCREPQSHDFLNEEQRTSGKFHIILGHVPDFAMGMPQADLLLAGHTHGGQVCIPFWGPIFINTKYLPLKWGSGHSVIDVPGEDRKINLIVSNGAGMERGLAPRIRFCCWPDIWVIDLVPKEKQK